MLRHKLNTPPVSPLEVDALVMDAGDSHNMKAEDVGNYMESISSVLSKDMAPLPNKPSKKRSGNNSAKTTESTFSSLLQPIFALFPPSQVSGSLAPAFESKPTSSQKETSGKQSNDTSSSKTKPMTNKADEDAFVIYQPTSWSAKRPKLTASRMARTFDWKTDVFGPSPSAVHGQRTKYPKPSTMAPLVREVGPPIQHSVLLRGMLRDRAGSLASMSDVSSFASTGEEELDNLLITPAHDRSLAEIAVASRSTLFSTLEDSLGLLGLPISPTGAVVERLSKMGVTSPNTRDYEEEGLNALKDEEMQSGSTPYTPLTPREIPDSDEESDDE